MYPKVSGYGNHDTESFDSYFSRWPNALTSIPKEVVEDWIYRHWSCFEDDWIDLAPHTWSFNRATFTNEEIMSIRHIGTWIEDLDLEGAEYVTDMPRGQTSLATFMKKHGTFPVPIIVAKDATHVVHPRSGGEFMKGPLQLIEGHCRLGCIRGMISSGYPTLQKSHQVWLAEIPGA